MSNIEYDETEDMEIDDAELISGKLAIQVPPEKHVESVDDILGKMMNKDSIPKQNLERALKIKAYERHKLLTELTEVKESLNHWFTEASFLQDRLKINAEEIKRIYGKMQGNCRSVK